MSRVGDVLYCDGCGVEITWSPVVRFHKAFLHLHGTPMDAGAHPPMFAYRQEFCCRDCSEGRACPCCERYEEESRRRGMHPGWVDTLGAADTRREDA